MKYIQFLSLAALASAFVLPDQHVFNDMAIEEDRFSTEAGEIGHDVSSGLKDVWHQASNDVEEAFKKVYDETEDAFDSGRDAITSWTDAMFGAKEWAKSSIDSIHGKVEDAVSELDHRHHRPGHGHHDKPNRTIYQLVAESKYTTKLAGLINKYPDLVETLNSTKANYTLFAPTDKAFEKIPDHAPEPTKQQLLDILSYHLTPDFYPAGRVLVTHTVPTALKGDRIPGQQRLSFHIGLRGLTVNFYSRIIAIDIFATNGVIHGIDSILIPPPRIIDIIDFLPSEYSTLELGLVKTGLWDALNKSESTIGGTFFAPSNFAFAKLGPRINAFLFSKYGLKYLKALLEYHVVPRVTLYSDAVYKADDDDESSYARDKVPKGLVHYNLPTLLKDRNLNVDVARYGGFIEMKINGFSRVATQDGIAREGVIQAVSDVIIPPKQGVSEKRGLFEMVESEMTIDELRERLEPYVE